MKSSVVASHRHSRDIAASMALVLTLVTACGQAGSPGSATLAPVPDPSPTATASAPATPTTTAVTTPHPTATPRPSGPMPVALGSRLRATIPGIAQPCAMSATATDVWVTGNGPSTLARIDPATNAIVAKVNMIGSPCGIAIGPDGRVWVAILTLGRVVAVDLATMKVVATVGGLGANLWDLKSGYGSIWVIDRTRKELLRIDPVKAVVSGRAEIGPSGSGLALTDGAVWIVDDLDGSIKRVDPATLSVTETAKLTGGASWFADDGNTLAVANRLDGSITVLDPATGAAGATIGAGRGPLDGTILGGRAYIPDGLARTLLEVDLATGSIAAADTLDGAKNPFVAEIAFGDVWVLDYGGQRIWRIAP